MDIQKIIMTIILVAAIFVLAIIFMNKREKSKNVKQEKSEEKLTHSSILATFIAVLATLTLLLGIYTIVIYQFEYGISLIILSIILFAISNIVYNLQYQTKILFLILKELKNK